jgi:hypothetical protein
MTVSQFLLHSELGHFIMYFAGIAFVGGMPAPTATSGIAYRWTFTSLNMFAANFKRAVSTKIENSPNWEAAVQAEIKKTNIPKG